MKATKCVWMLIVACALSVQATLAQDRKEGQKPPRMSWEKMQEMQINFIAKSMGLSGQDTEKFEEVYKEYNREMRGLMGNPPQRPERDNKKPEGEKKEWKEPTDEEVEAMLKGRFARSRKMLDLHEKYYDKYRKFLSPKQIQKIYDFEMMNMGRVQQEINRRNMMRGQGNGQTQQASRPGWGSR